MNRAFKPRLGSEDGNVFLAIFGAIALVGLLGASVMTFMKGPLSTSVRLTKINTAENQMAIGSQVAVMATANQANSGDCDADGSVEPIEWRAATVEPHPVNGGLVPQTLGISKKDPWGTEYGYCVWNHGTTIVPAGTCGANMLQGTNSHVYPVVALVSAGPDKVFTTTCRSFATADANSNGVLDGSELPLVGKAAETDDDIITSYTYEEATGVSGGLWSIKSSDPTTAVINKKIETSGTANLKGGILLPDKALITCDASNAGVMAKDGSNGIAICDGSAWTSISGGVAGGGLVLTPNTKSGMDVAGGCGSSTCYSANQTFTLTNNLSPAASSVALVTTLSNTANFQIVSDNCNGQIIAAAANCMIVVRAKATGNRAYAGTLQITGNNSPLATLDGTASGFSCTVGGDAPGGKYVGCGIGGYNLITTPGGCTGSTSNPTCAGGNDTLNLTAVAGNNPNNNYYPSTGADGGQSTADLAAYTSSVTSFPAANWCDALDYGGYQDWFLPSQSQAQNYLYPNRVAVGGVTGVYWTSTNAWNGGVSYNIYMDSASGSIGNQYFNQPYHYRCMRWDPVKTYTPIADNTPAALGFNSVSTATAGSTVTSNSVTIEGISTPTNISISGGSGAKYSKNGGAYTSASGTVVNGDIITLQATSPTAGQQDSVTVNVGSGSTAWIVRTVANNTIFAFVTTNKYDGSRGGAAAVDTICNSDAAAAGLGGSWIGLVGFGSSSSGPATRMPWNWSTLKNMAGQVVATSYADFTDGTWSAPISKTASGATSTNSYVWTGSGDYTGVSGYSSWLGASHYCSGWNSSSSGVYGSVGTIGSTSTMFLTAISSMAGFPTCNNQYPFYCVQDPGSALVDTDPADVTIRPGITFSSGAVASSNTVTVTAILQAVTISITPSAGTANIIKNGVSVGATTTTANPNDTIQFTLTAPTTLGTKNTATINFGDDTYSWWSGYADSAKEAKVFVTSTTYGTGNFGGLSGMDAICKSHATSSPYGLSTNWKVMASDSNVSMATRVPWSWGVLKTVTGTVVANGYNDLFDGTLQNALNITEGGASVSGSSVTGSDAYGVKYYPGITPPPAARFNNDWTYGGCTGGIDGVYGNITSTTQWAYIGTYNGNCSGGLRMICIEDVDNAVLDTTPNTILAPYKVQVATSSRQSSSAWVISGMSSGATTTIGVSGSSGSPTFTVNGGAEVTSAAGVKNGDSLVFKMDAPATGNSNNKMTITANSGADIIGYWRVWTGDTTGTKVKRIFIGFSGSVLAGVTSYDTACNSNASSAGLGGTWKAVISGISESEYAVNRVGYDWTTLRRVDGTDVALSGNLWNTASVPLLSTVSLRANGATYSATSIVSNTSSAGMAKSVTASDNPGSCNNWGTNSSGMAAFDGTSGSNTTAWIEDGSPDGSNCYYCCGGGQYFYCMEQ